MTNVFKTLISHEIISWMEAQGFSATEAPDHRGDTTLYFQYKEPYEKAVSFGCNGAIRCTSWNDEERAERYCSTLEVTKSCPTLEEWMLLMHIGRMVCLPGLTPYLRTQKQAA